MSAPNGVFLIEGAPEPVPIPEDTTATQTTPQAEEDLMGSGNTVPCWWWCPKKPKSEGNCDGCEVDEGATTVQAAYSFTVEAIVTTTTCWGHSVEVGVFASGGLAADDVKAGDKLTYATRRCDTIQSQGEPVRERSVDHFWKRTYSDNSYKVFGKSHGNSVLVEAFTASYGPQGTTVTMRTTQPFVREVTENNAGGVFFKGSSGAFAFGVGLGASIWANGEEESRVKIELRPLDASTHEYKINFVNGNQGTTGIVGEAWKLS